MTARTFIILVILGLLIFTVRGDRKMSHLTCGPNGQGGRTCVPSDR